MLHYIKICFTLRQYTIDWITPTPAQSQYINAGIYNV